MLAQHTPQDKSTSHELAIEYLNRKWRKVTISPLSFFGASWVAAGWRKMGAMTMVRQDELGWSAYVIDGRNCNTDD